MVPIRLSWHWIATNLQFVKEKRKEKAKSAKHNKVRHSKMKKKKKEAHYFPHHSQENIPKNNPFV